MISEMDQLAHLARLVTLNASPIRWSETQLVVLVRPPSGFAAHLALQFSCRQISYKILTVPADQKASVLTATSKIELPDASHLLGLIEANGGTKTVASWGSHELGPLKHDEINILYRLSYQGLWALYDRETTSPATLPAGIPDELASRLTVLETMPALVVQADMLHAERDILANYPAAKRLANLPLPTFPATSAPPYMPIYQTKTHYPSIAINPSHGDDLLTQFKSYNADFDIGIRIFNEILYHPTTGTCFHQSGDLIHDTTWHVLPQENDILPFYTAHETGWHVWQTADIPTPEHIDGTYFLATTKYASNYFHWFNEIVPRLWVFLQCCELELIDPQTPIVLPQIPTGGFQEAFLRMLPVPFEQFLFWNGSYIKLETAIIPRLRTDESQRFTPTMGFFRLQGTPKPFWDWLYNIVKRPSEITPAGPRYIYISRADIGKRTIINEADIMPILHAYGFHIMHPGQLSLAEQIAIVRNAELIIGPHGAGLTNCAFSPPGAKLLEIRTARNIDIGYRFLCQYRGTAYEAFEATEVPVSSRLDDPKDFDMYVDLEKFKAVLAELAELEEDPIIPMPMEQPRAVDNVTQVQIETPISDEMANHSERYAGSFRAGSFSPSTMRDIEQLLRPLKLTHTAETGCGKTTILFSQLSSEHTIFTIDDRIDGEEASLNFVLDYPGTRRESLRVVFGPTQRSLPRHNFESPLDCVFLDGPHGFPFPELEYYFFYPHLRTGALLFVNNIEIPTIERFWNIVKEDRMFELVAEIKPIGVLRRTDAPTFDPYGDNWCYQRYNQRRVPRGSWNYAED